jgi:hypothetical protein
MRLSIKIIVFLLFALLFGCVKQKPQLPANKDIAIDSTHLTLQLANEKLIYNEDSLLNEYVQHEDKKYIKDENGYWYYIYRNNTGKNNWKTAQINYSVYSLDNEFYFSKIETIKFEKNQLIPTLNELLKKMNPGDSAITIAPWYLAYGLKGNEHVPAYTSLKIRLKLLEE